MKELIPLVKTIASQFGIEPGAGMAFIATETGGLGFDTVTGKIIIQFEPKWFKTYAPYAPSGLWSLNGVERQSKEWQAFNDAFAKNPIAAMEATSIGLGQIMGEHYARLGYKSVGEMWDDAKKGLDRQIWQMFKFIATDPKLLAFLKVHNWDGVARFYNGAYYKKMAAKWHRTPYDQTMAQNYSLYKNI